MVLSSQQFFELHNVLQVKSREIYHTMTGTTTRTTRTPPSHPPVVVHASRLLVRVPVRAHHDHPVSLATPFGAREEAEEVRAQGEVGHAGAEQLGRYIENVL